MRIYFVTILALLVVAGCGGNSNGRNRHGVDGNPLIEDQGILGPDEIDNLGTPAENAVAIGTGDSTKTIKVQGSFFTGKNKVGDFRWMIDRSEYSKTLFVFNDNEEQFRDFQSKKNDQTNLKKSKGCKPGSGNATIRHKQCDNPPRAAGVPTGSKRKGYKELSPQVRELIKQSIDHIRHVLEQGDYDTVLFSQEPNTRMIGAGIFKISNEVKEYIFESLLNLNAA